MSTIMALFSLFVFISHVSFLSQEQNIYKHPSLNFQFEATGEWLKIQHNEDKFIYELMNSDSSIHVILWYTETEQNGKEYLSKMAGMKNLITAEKTPFSRTINNREIWLLNLSGIENGVPVQMLLGVVTHGRSETRPKENRLFIVQIWCNKDNYEIYKDEFENLLQSVKISS